MLGISPVVHYVLVLFQVGRGMRASLVAVNLEKESEIVKWNLWSHSGV